MVKRTGEPIWADLWLDALGAVWGTRLKRGVALARAGAVGGLRVRPGGATAGVRDPAGGAYTPQVAVRPLRQDEWVATATALLGDPVLAAALDAGLLPVGAAPVLTAAGVALLPGAADLAADCACGERLPCRHVAALVYAVAAALEADPWLLPLLRGRDRSGFSQTLAVARADLTPQSPSLRTKGESNEGLYEGAESSSSPPFVGEDQGERSSSSPPPLGEGRGERSAGTPPFVGEGRGERSVAVNSALSTQHSALFFGEGQGERSAGTPPPLGEGLGERSSSSPPPLGEGRGERSVAANSALRTQHSELPQGEGRGEGSAAASFWHPGSALATLSIPITAPPQPAAALRQLGPPPFWTPPTAFLPQLEPVYAAVTAAVLRLLADPTGDGSATE